MKESPVQIQPEGIYSGRDVLSQVQKGHRKANLAGSLRNYAGFVAHFGASPGFAAYLFD